MSCYYLVSHGGYLQNNKTSFKIPDNIRLVQYTAPGSLLTSLAASRILKSPCSSSSIPKSVPKDFYIVTEEGDLLREEVVKKILEPGEKTVDLVLTFGKDVAGIPLGVYKKDKNQELSIIFKNKEEVNILLSDYLKMLSESVFKGLLREKDTVVIHQLSCRYEFEEEPEKNKLKIKPPSDADLDEVIRSFKSNRIIEAPPLFRTDKKFFDKKVVLYTDNKEEAKEKAAPLWRKQTLKNASIKRKNETFKKIKEDRLFKSYKSLFKNTKKHSYDDKIKTMKEKKAKRTTKRKTKKVTNPFLKYLSSITG